MVEQRSTSEALRALSESVDDVLFVATLEGGDAALDLLSPAYEAVFGRSVASAVARPRSVLESVHPADRKSLCQLLASPADETAGGELRLRVRRPTGEVRWLWVRCFPVATDERRVAGIATDITARHLADERLQRSAEELEHQVETGSEALQALLRELHHRVKNSLQLVASLLYLQSATVDEPTALAALSAARARIHSLALLYEPLYQTADLDSVDMRRYLRDLASPLGHPFASERPGIRVDTQIDDIWLDLERAIACGLLVNELVMNAYAHAYPEQEGKIRLELRRHGDTLQLTVADEGVGLPLVLAHRAGETPLGLRLVRRLVLQLDGRLDVHRSSGTTLEVRFPVDPL